MAERPEVSISIMLDPFKIYTKSEPSSNKKVLEWDESALDSQVGLEKVLDKDKYLARFWWLWAILFLSFAILLGRLFHLQIIKGNEYRALSENNRIRIQTILAPRGLVYDSYGEILVQNKASFNLVVIPFDLPEQGLSRGLELLAETFDLDLEETEEILSNVNRNSIEPVVIKQGITQEESILFETKANDLVGFSVQKIPIREYLDSKNFSHIMGYTGLLSSGDLEVVDRNIYATVDFIGKSGLELKYEDFLRGQNGQNLVEVEASGKAKNLLGEKSPTPGNSLVLNIDKQLQKELYEGLSARPLNQKAAAVAMNPKNGKVLALVSLPGFDNNLFAKGIESGEYKSLINDANLPLFNRAISGVYPPGSTVKPIVAAAALEEGIVKDTTVINDRGVLVIPNQYDPTISYNFFGWKRDGLGPVNVRMAIAKSSDIFFYIVGGGHPSSPIQGLGVDRLAEYYRRFNSGKLTGIDLPGEKPGLVADPQWKAGYYKDDAVLSKWYLGNTYHVAIGQGDMLTTPLQVTFWTSLVANDGVGFKPKILDSVENPSGEIIFKSEPEVLVENFISEENMRIVQEGMRQTILEGSGVRLLDLPVSSAGKTGTSQFDGSDPSRTHAWFTAYAPFEDPEIAITVLVEAGGEGHAVAVPVVKDVLEWWAENRHKD